MKKIYHYILDFFNYKAMAIYQIIITRKIVKKQLKTFHEIPNKSKIADEGIRYWESKGKKIKPYWHEWYYLLNGVNDARYVPEDIFYSEIEPYLNNVALSKAYGDKGMYDLFFKEAKLPNTFFKNINGIIYNKSQEFISFDKMINELSNNQKVIIKATIESGGGKNIQVIDETNPEIFRTKLIKTLKEFKTNYVIQEFIEQHQIIEKMNPSSVNTIRMMTLIVEGRVEYLSAHIRIGVDNHVIDHNGIVCGLNEEGITSNQAYKYKIGTPVDNHPQGYNFSNIKIPGFQEAIKIAKSEHKKFGHFRLISWDFAIDKFGDPILIEFNLRFQGLNHIQITNGPVFGEHTDEVLEEIYSKEL